MAQFEDTLRQKLPTESLGPPVGDSSKLSAGSHVSVSAGSQVPKGGVDGSLALRFDEHGAVVEDVVCAARERGFAIGSAVRTVRTARGVPKGSVGTLVSFTAKVPVVTFDAVDGAEALENIEFPLLSLEPFERPKPSKKQKTTAAAPPSIEGVEWAPCDASDAHEELVAKVKGLNNELRVQYAPAHEQVALKDEATEPSVLLAKIELQAFALRLIPRADALENVKVKKGEDTSLLIKVSCADAKDEFFRRVQSTPVKYMSGTKTVLDAAAFVQSTAQAARDHTSGHTNLTWALAGPFRLPLAGNFTSVDRHFKPVGGKDKVVAEVTVPYLTNSEVAASGVALAGPPL